LYSSAQGEQDETKAAKMKIEAQQRLEETHMKQLRFFENVRTELEQQVDSMNADNNTIKNGRNANVVTFRSATVTIIANTALCIASYADAL